MKNATKLYYTAKEYLKSFHKEFGHTLEEPLIWDIQVTTPCGAGVMLRATDYGYKPAPIVSVYLTSPAPNNEMMELFRADGDPHTGNITLEEADKAFNKFDEAVAVLEGRRFLGTLSANPR